LYRKFGKYAEALKDLSEANKHMNIDNNCETVLKQMSITYNELSLYLMNKKNYTDALKILDEALKFNKDDVSIYLNKYNLV
jgi:tetratricopeptide (TPR) repeat protein